MHVRACESGLSYVDVDQEYILQDAQKPVNLNFSQASSGREMDQDKGLQLLL